jgi:hypothetical protein
MATSTMATRRERLEQGLPTFRGMPRQAASPDKAAKPSQDLNFAPNGAKTPRRLSLPIPTQQERPSSLSSHSQAESKTLRRSWPETQEAAQDPAFSRRRSLPQTMRRHQAAQQVKSSI